MIVAGTPSPSNPVAPENLVTLAKKKGLAARTTAPFAATDGPEGRLPEPMSSDGSGMACPGPVMGAATRA